MAFIYYSTTNIQWTAEYGSAETIETDFYSFIAASHYGSFFSETTIIEYTINSTLIQKDSIYSLADSKGVSFSHFLFTNNDGNISTDFLASTVERYITSRHTYTTETYTALDTLAFGSSTSSFNASYVIGTVIDGQNSTTTSEELSTFIVSFWPSSTTVESIRTVSSTYTISGGEMFRPIVVDPYDFYQGDWIISITNTTATGIQDPALIGELVSEFTAFFAPEIIVSTRTSFFVSSYDDLIYTDVTVTEVREQINGLYRKTISHALLSDFSPIDFPFGTQTSVLDAITTYDSSIIFQIKTEQPLSKTLTRSVIYEFLRTLTSATLVSTSTVDKSFYNSVDGSFTLTITNHYAVFSSITGNFFGGHSSINTPFVTEFTSATFTDHKFTTVYTIQSLNPETLFGNSFYFDYPVHLQAIIETKNSFLLLENQTNLSDKRYLSVDFGLNFTMIRPFGFNEDQSIIPGVFERNVERILVRSTYTHTEGISSTIVIANWSDSIALMTQYNGIGGSTTLQNIISYTEATREHNYNDYGFLKIVNTYYPIFQMRVRPFGDYLFVQHNSSLLRFQTSFHWALGNLPFSDSLAGAHLRVSDEGQYPVLCNKTSYNENGSTSFIGYVSANDKITGTTNLAMRQAQYYINLGTDHYLKHDETYGLLLPSKPFALKQKRAFQGLDFGFG